jgi:hypothetical protein
VRGQRHAPAALYPGKDPVLIVQEAGWAPGPVWTGAENLASTGIRSPDRPARSQSLYQLRYPTHVVNYDVIYLTAIGKAHGGSSSVHIHTNNTENDTKQTNT